MPTESPPGSSPRPPTALAVVGSVAALLHFFLIVVGVLAAPSGPWPTMDGANLATPPQFAFTIHSAAMPVYHQPLKLTHNYHFATNRPGIPGVYFEALLKDAQGQATETLRFPEPDANFWTAQRQLLLAQALTDDVPVPPALGETIPAPGQQTRKLTIWEPAGENKLVLKQIDEHLVPRDRPVFRPSEWSLLAARSYARHLARAHGAAAVEIVRVTKQPIPPAALFVPNLPPMPFAAVASSFGDMK